MTKDELTRVYQLKERGEPDAAAKICADCLNANPKDAEAIFALGSVMISCERFGVASVMFARVAELVPQSWEALTNYGLTLLSVNKFEEAEQVLHKAHKIAPDQCSTLNNMALLNMNLVRPEKALEYAEKSLAIKPGQPEALETLGYAKLMLGDFKAGWGGYEAMIQPYMGGPTWEWQKGRKIKPLGDEPYWKGEKQGRLYIKGEQGVGDEISFASILPDAAKDNEIIFDCDPKLAGLFKRSFPNVEVHGTRHTKNKPWKDYRQIDYGCLIGTLASRYRTQATDFPGTPYLVADPQRRLQWRSLLDTLPGKKIGIAWTGGLTSTFTHRRSLALETLLPILKTEGVSWVSLQYKDPSGEISRFTRRHKIPVHHWARAAESQDYDDQAALVAELDAVVTVTTAIVHLSGALGVPCYVLVPSKPRWFYQLSGSTLPWYSSVRMFRQTDHWPMDSVRQALASDLKLEVPAMAEVA